MAFRAEQEIDTIRNVDKLELNRNTQTEMHSVIINKFAANLVHDSKKFHFKFFQVKTFFVFFLFCLYLACMVDTEMRGGNNGRNGPKQCKRGPPPARTINEERGRRKLLVKN